VTPSAGFKEVILTSRLGPETSRLAFGFTQWHAVSPGSFDGATWLRCCFRFASNCSECEELGTRLCLFEARELVLDCCFQHPLLSLH
jgi:hypothetical protein